LGAGIANILTMMLNQHINEFRTATGSPSFSIRGYCFATPAVANHSLADPFEDLIDNCELFHHCFSTF
jgi:hypothetical protein